MLKVGFLVSEFGLKKWEIDLITNVSSLCEVILVRCSIIHTHSKRKKNCKSKFRHYINLCFLYYIAKIENKFIDRSLVDISTLKYEVINIQFNRTGSRDYLLDTEAHKIKEFDLLFRIGLNIISGSILSIPKYGVWGLHHGSFSDFRGGPPGFWEVVKNVTFSEVTLQRYSEIIDGGKVVEVASISTRGFWKKNENLLVNLGVTIATKNIRKLVNELPVEYKNVRIGKLRKFPSFKYILLYIFKVHLLYPIRLLFFRFITQKQNFSWNVAVKIMPNDFDLFDFNSPDFVLKASADNFYADPFILSHKDDIVELLLEKYSKNLNRATLSYFKINLSSKSVEFSSDVKGLSNLHYSFPFIFEISGSYFLLPENKEIKGLRVYSYSIKDQVANCLVTYLSDYYVVDPVIFQYNDQYWLSFNSDCEVNGDFNVKLFLFKIENYEQPTNWHLVSHKLNPVLNHGGIARNGGRYFNRGDSVFRIGQINYGNLYGRGIIQSKIVDLSEDTYSEVIVNKYEASHYSFSNLHHIDFKNKIIVYDYV
jgi:hypothetical protein